MAVTGNESDDLSFSESTDFGDNDKTSDSSSVLQSSPEPLHLGSPGTDENLSNAINEQMKVSSTLAESFFDLTSGSSSVLQSSSELQQASSPGTDQIFQMLSNEQMNFTSTPSRKRGASSATQDNDNRKKACLQWLRYFNEMIVYTKRIESQDVFNLVKPQRSGIAFSDLVKKAPKQNLQLTGRDLHVYLMNHLVNNDERVDSLQILKVFATLEEAKVFLLRADTALRLDNKHLLAVSIEAGINFERAFEIHQAEKKNGLVPYWEHWIKEITYLGKSQVARLRQISRLLAPYPKFKQLSVPFTEIFERRYFIQHKLQDENIAKEWK